MAEIIVKLSKEELIALTDKLKEAPAVPVQELQKIKEGNETLKGATFIPVIHVRGSHIPEEKANAISKSISHYVSSLYPEKTESIDSK